MIIHIVLNRFKILSCHSDSSRSKGPKGTRPFGGLGVVIAITGKNKKIVKSCQVFSGCHRS